VEKRGGTVIMALVDQKTNHRRGRKVSLNCMLEQPATLGALKATECYTRKRSRGYDLSAGGGGGGGGGGAGLV